jgi:cell division protein ZapA
MGQVSVTLNGRTYRLECGDGEEAHLIALSEHLGSHVDTMKRKFGQIGDDRLILMAALMVTDELWEMRRQTDELQLALQEVIQNKDSADRDTRSAENGLAGAIGAAADRLELLSERIGSKRDR